MSNLRYWGQIQKVSQIKPRSAHCSGLVLPYLVLSSDLEFFKEVFCLFICRGFDFVGFFLIWNRPGQSKNLEYFHSCWICRALPQPKGRTDPACAQQGPTERATGAQGHNSPSLDKPPVAPGPRVSPSTSLEEKHLFRYQVSGAGEGSFWSWQDGIFLWSRSQRWDSDYITLKLMEVFNWVSGPTFTGKLSETGSSSPSYFHGSLCKAGRGKIADN